MDNEERTEIAFTFDGASFDDKASGERLTLGGSGRVIVDASLSADEKARASGLLGAAAAKTLEGMSTVCDAYEKIPYRADDWLNMLRTVVRAEDAALAERAGSLIVTGVWPDDESMARLARGRKAKREADAMREAEARREAEAKRPAENPAQDAAAARCPSCGADLSARPNAKFCTKCGAPLRSAAGAENAATESPLAAYIRRNYTTATKAKAIAYYREQTGAGLADAKRAVEKILEG